MSLLIKNIGELFDGNKIIKDTCVYIDNGKIRSIGKEIEADEIIDAEKKFVMPGFIDSHTHAIFHGSREFEIEWKIEGVGYKEIAERGGGIYYTVEETRKAGRNELKKETMKRVNEMIKYGTTTVEIKSGYGLDKKNEIKLLEIINEVNEHSKATVIPTFLAHAIPDEMDADYFVDMVINEILPEISKKNLAVFCDVFCENGYFNLNQSKKILLKGKEYGLLPKIHADEFSCIGCSKLASEIKAVSADHLLMTGEEEMRMLAKSNVVATLLPATPFVLNESYPKARKMISNNVEIALATDMNPNCYITNMQFIIQLACYKMKMRVIDALKAVTLNSAKALKMDDKIGSIENGKNADIIIMDIPSYLFIPYKIGVNHVNTVIKNGEIIYSQE
ncbi:MAG TPA: imidazolonepropionase [Thermoplasmata archaeon]|nr:imidazolonepropionase [Thermoplasmata archaeon]